MSECPRSDSAATLAAPAAAAAAPSVATATALNLARAVLALSAEEEIPPGAAAAPAAAIRSSATRKTPHKHLKMPTQEAAGGVEGEDGKETPQPAAAVFRDEELMSSGVETPEETPVEKTPDTAALTLPAAATSLTASTTAQHSTTAGGRRAVTIERSYAAAAAVSTPASTEKEETALEPSTATSSVSSRNPRKPRTTAEASTHRDVVSPVNAAQPAERATTEAATDGATTEMATTERAPTEMATTEAATERAPTEMATTDAATERAPTEMATTEAATERAATERAPTEMATTDAATERAPTEMATTEAATERAATERAPTEMATTEAARGSDQEALAFACPGEFSTFLGEKATETAAAHLGAAGTSLRPREAAAAEVPEEAAVAGRGALPRGSAGMYAGRGLKRAPEGCLQVDETAERLLSERQSRDDEGLALLMRLQQQRSCLIITDVQNDFCEGGTLGGPGRRAVISRINHLRQFLFAAICKQQGQQNSRQQQQKEKRNHTDEVAASASSRRGRTSSADAAPHVALSKTNHASTIAEAQEEAVRKEATRGEAAAADAAQGEAASKVELPEETQAPTAAETNAAAEAAEGEAAEGEATARASEHDMSAKITSGDAEELDTLFSIVVVSQDWHPPDHLSFACIHSRSCNPHACTCGDVPATSSTKLLSADAAAAEARGEVASVTAPPTETTRDVTDCEKAANIEKAASGKPSHAPAEKEQQPPQPQKETIDQQAVSKEANTEQQDMHLGLMRGKRIRRATSGLLLDLWPVHCVQNSFGAALHSALITRPTDIYIKKGTRKGVENYSCFGSKCEDTGLTAVLQKERIEVIVIVGFTTEYCVRATALSALTVPGVNAVYVLTDCCCSIDPQQEDAVFRGMQQKGVRLCSLQQLLTSAANFQQR